MTTEQRAEAEARGVRADDAATIAIPMYSLDDTCPDCAEQDGCCERHGRVMAAMAAGVTPAAEVQIEYGVTCGFVRFCDRPRGHADEHGAWVETSMDRIVRRVEAQQRERIEALERLVDSVPNGFTELEASNEWCEEFARQNNAEYDAALSASREAPPAAQEDNDDR